MKALLAAALLALALPAPVQDDRQKTIDALLADLEGKAGQYWNVPREDGKFLNMLVKMTGAKRALELGTANGYSGIWIGLGLEATGGQLTTVEINPEKAEEARANFEKAGLAGRIKVVEGDGHKVARELEGPFDFVFIDADMGNDLDYLNVLFPKVSPGGVILRHNAITYANTMKDYLEAVKKHPDLDTAIVSCTMKDGFAVSYKKKK
jgi:predicted O-methyltransferase YrrM